MYQVALFGAGRIGKVHAAGIASLPEAVLRYVSDVDGAAASALAARHGAEAATVEQVLADPQVAAVVVASSTDTHAELILRAAEAGKAVFCEKPIDLDLARAKACRDVLAASDAFAMVGFNRRFDPSFAALKARLDAGQIGRAEVLSITSRDPEPPPLDYVARSGGIFRDMLIHDFDMFRWLLGEEAVAVHAVGSCLVEPALAGLGDADTVLVTLRTGSGRLCQIGASRRAVYGYDQRIEVLGSAGMLQAGNLRRTEVRLATAEHVAEDLPPYFFLERYHEAYRRELAGFFADLAAGRPPSPSLEDGVRALELAEAATLSWREGREVVL
jgi:myo-inositol 2-dehydrogenase/D-chiro-inositol 1-dehydrogenase